MALDPTTSDTLAFPSSGAAAPAIPERYEILELLGSGGMGNVYKARDHELDELVALKVLRPELTGSAGALERFRREVKLARRVTHPNVARVFDIGERGGDRILTMELVDGESLAARVARVGRPSTARVTEIALAICAGLGAAHAAGVIHRDLKPDNVLIEEGGRVVLTDFGIARAAAESAALLTGASLVGTPAYMAPEQIEGGAAIDGRADLYAFGAMLYELFTGQRPWQGEHLLAVATARLYHPPPDPRALRPDLPPGLAAIVLRCMARRPEDRYASAAEVASALAAIALPAPGLSIAPPPPRPEPTREIARAAGVGQTPITPSAPGPKLVAVLPFRNAGPPEQSYVADGLTEDVIDLLSVVPGLRVRSRGVVMRYQGVERDPREIGREIDVQVVVEGTVRRAGGGVRISARLVSVSDGIQLWARRFDRPDAELLCVSDDVARAIAEALAVEPGAPARRAEVDPEAMDLYLRARAAYNSFFSDLQGSSLKLFERAMELAPDEPRILSGYAMSRARFWSTEPTAARLAEAAATRAVELAPGSAHAHVALGTIRFQAGEEEGPVRSLRHALRIAPAEVEAHDLLGRILAEAGLITEARRHLATALALEPNMALARVSLARLHALDGAHDEAERVMSEEPITALAAKTRLLLWRRDLKAAAALLAEPDPGSLLARPLGAALMLIIRGERPYEIYARFSEVAGTAPRVMTFFAQLEAEAAMLLDDHAHALGAITRATGSALYDLAWMNGCPLLADLRGDPTFLALHARVAARAARIERAYREP